MASEGNGVVEGVREGMEKVEGERVGCRGFGVFSGEIGEVGLEVGEFDSGEGPLAFEMVNGGDFLIEEGTQEVEAKGDGVRFR